MRSLVYSRRNPYTLMLVLAMGGSVIIFLVLTALFFNRAGMADWVPIQLPVVFWVSTFIMFFSSFALEQARENYRTERYDHFKNWIGFTLLLGALFMLSQAAGWYDLINTQASQQGSVSAAFLYLMSGLHAAHIILGLVVLVMVYRDAMRNTEYVDGFITSLNPVKATRLKLLTMYWHFVDVLWIGLFLLFVAYAG